MSDNGSAYRSFAFRDLLAEHRITHKRTRPYTPRTNGKAERFIQTSLREWAYAQPFQTSAERANALPPWIADYNLRRPHSALGGYPPMSRITAPPTVPPSVPFSDLKQHFGRVAGVKSRAGLPSRSRDGDPDRRRRLGLDTGHFAASTISDRMGQRP